MKPQATLPRLAPLLAIATLALAGCYGELAGNAKAPEAKLEVAEGPHWSGSTVTFDAQSSSDPNGNLTEWRFDFGDGQSTTASREDDARVDHVYDEAGRYTAKVTVVDDGKGQDEAMSDTTAVTVVVNERDAVRTVVAALPGNTTGNATAKTDVPFEARDGAESYESNLTVTGRALVGTSRVLVELLDPAGNVLASKSVDVDAGQQAPLELAGNLTQAGPHTLRMTAQSGAAEVAGELRVYYD